MCHLLVTDMSHLSDVSDCQQSSLLYNEIFPRQIPALKAFPSSWIFSESILPKQVLGLPPPQAALRWLPVFCDVFQLEKPKRGSVHVKFFWSYSYRRYTGTKVGRRGSRAGIRDRRSKNKGWIGERTEQGQRLARWLGSSGRAGRRLGSGLYKNTGSPS